MPYIELYNRSQNNTVPLSLSWLVNDAQELTWVHGIESKRTDDLDAKICRGFIIENPSHLFPNFVGNFLIVTSKSLNRCWERFVFIKELMHVYDKSISKTDTSEKLDRQLAELANLSSTEEMSPQMQDEVRAVWMALGISCPEEKRVYYKNKLESGALTEGAVAKEILIPAAYIRHLVSDLYDQEIHRILNP